MKTRFDAAMSRSEPQAFYPRYLRRLAKGNYQGLASVHWTMTMRNRAIGWLTDDWHLSFRELVLHSICRYGIICPIYCLMPDHVHLIWVGIAEAADQRLAKAHLRRYSHALILQDAGFEWQKQSYDHVLREWERDRDAFVNLVGDVQMNPVRASLITESSVQDYPYLGCMVPGYPDLSIWQDEYWPLFWKIHGRMLAKGDE